MKIGLLRLLNRETLSVFLLALGLWLLNHRYGGIWHDARIYTLLALHQLSPEQFFGDPWFVPKTADGLSIFPYCYGWVIQILGVNLATQTLVLLGAIIWITAIHHLTRLFFSQNLASLLTLLFASIPLNISPDASIFVISENFVTARIFAIPLTLFALTALVQKRHKLFFCFTLSALLFHPLLSIWGLGIAAGVYFSDRRFALLTSAAILIFSLLILNIPNWPDLKPMAGDWQTVVNATAFVVIHKTWPAIAINDPLWWFAALLLGSQLGTPKIRRFYLATAHISAYALLASLIVSYFTQNIFLLQAQLWRALWLAAFFGFIAAVDVGWASQRLFHSKYPALAFLAVTFLARDYGGGLILITTAIIYLVFPERLNAWLNSHRDTGRKVLWYCTLVIVLFFFPDGLMDAYIFLSMDPLPRSGIFKDNLVTLLHLLQLGALPVVLWWIHHRWLSQYGNIVRLSATLLFAFCCLSFWDARTDWLRFEEARYHWGRNRDIFATSIPPGKSVYWPNHSLRVWFDLGAPSYVSSEQAIGIVFSYARMLEVRRRLQHIQVRDEPPLPLSADELKSRQEARENPNLHSLETKTIPTAAGIGKLCADSALDYFIDSTSFPALAIASQTETMNGQQRTYYLYDCAQLRNRPESLLPKQLPHPA